MMAPMRVAPLMLATALLGLAPAGAHAQSLRLGPLLAPGDVPSVQMKAPPKSETVAILILSGAEAGVPLSEVYAGARKVIERHTAINVAPLDAIGIDEREAAIRECAGKAACFARRVRGGAANLLLTVSVDRIDEDGGTLLGLRLVDIETEAQIGAAGDEIPAGMSMLGAMEQQLPNVIPSSVWDQIGVLKISTEPAQAEVTAAGRSCVSPCELKRVVPGTYEVTIRKAGYIDWTGPVTVEASRTATLERVLEEPEGSIASSPWLWAGIGAAVIGAGIAAAFLLQGDDDLVNVCIAPDQSNCGAN